MASIITLSWMIQYLAGIVSINFENTVWIQLNTQDLYLCCYGVSVNVSYILVRKQINNYILIILTLTNTVFKMRI